MSSINDTLKERGNRYGDFTDHAVLCQNLKDVMKHFVKESPPGISVPWDNLSCVQKQALEVIADKIARILSGDPNYADNWHDIQGYAKLVEESLPAYTPNQATPDVGSASPSTNFFTSNNFYKCPNDNAVPPAKWASKEGHDMACLICKNVNLPGEV